MYSRCSVVAESEMSNIQYRIQYLASILPSLRLTARTTNWNENHLSNLLGRCCVYSWWKGKKLGSLLSWHHAWCMISCRKALPFNETQQGLLQKHIFLWPMRSEEQNHFPTTYPVYQTMYLLYLPTYPPSYLPSHQPSYLPTYLCLYLSIYRSIYFSICSIWDPVLSVRVNN